MKRNFVTVILILFIVNNSTAQKRDIVSYKQNWDKQVVFWGYYLGLNQKSFKISYTEPDTYVNVTSTSGFEVGLIGDLRLHKNINLRLEPGLSSNTKLLEFMHIEGSEYVKTREVNGTYLRIPLLLKFSADRLNNMRPYVIGGASYDFNFSSNQDNPNDNLDGEFRMTKNNFTYEIGVGVDLYLPYFIFSPSIRGVFAINNELVRDVDPNGNIDPNSPWTGPIDFFGTRGIFIKFAFH
ncbi:MAG: PorT family protein [Lutibacter sp.]|uniref:type IX secretion/gliding motility protein PorT/SprT n=1 Tax=Lutibacter sp. TaxID=1925666 RepID=UPI00185AE682|nr:porin family protein [Lutibacter sp.]MBT8316375.1 PorT family protein [Lutibacter sp.]NNJ57235.1 PorT family protein [Lutibacter sp.]